MKSNWRFTFTLVALLGIAVVATADDSSRRFAAREGNLAITCPLTIGGSFIAKTSSLAGEFTVSTAGSLEVTGGLEADLATLETGIGLRDRHLMENYLEIGKGGEYEKASLSDLVLELKGALGDGECAFTANLVVHAVKQPVSGKAKIVSKGDGYHVAGTFPLRIPDFGIAKPRHLGVGVKDEVLVGFEFLLEPVSAAANGGRS